MVSLDVLGSNVQRAWALWRLGTRGGFFFKSQSLNRKSNSYAFFPFFFCIKNGQKGQGKQIGLSGSLSINLTRKT